MNPLQAAIALMTKEEVRAFKLFVRKVDVQAGRKDLELFDAIRKSGSDYDESATFSKIYPEASKNTFHRLKSRLLHDINRSMVDLSLDNNDTIRLWHFLSVVEFYLIRGHAELAHWFLRKAESLAQRLGNMEALDIIFGSYIRLSHLVPDINPEAYIAVRADNAAQLRQVRALDDLLAIAAYRTKVGQTWGERGAELMQMLETTVNEFAQQDHKALNPATRIKLFQSVSSILLDRRDYLMMETYVLETFQSFEKEGVFNRITHETKLRMLTYLANALYKNGKFESSLKYAELLGREMKEYDSVLQDRYLFFFYNAMMINYFQLDIQKALALLIEMKSNPTIMDSPFHALFIDMNLALGYFQSAQFTKAIKHIVAAQHLEAYKSAAEGLRLRICIAELMIRLKLNQYEVLEQRIKQVSKDFGAELISPEFAREAAMMNIIGSLNADSQNQASKKIQDAIKRFLKTSPEEDAQDAELIAYDPFVKEYLKH